MKLTNIRKTYHNKNNTIDALKGITLSIEDTGITMILGSSGSGKTTLMNCIASRESYEGTIEDVPHFDYLTQEFNLFENMSVLDNLLLVSEDKKLIDHYLKEFYLETSAHKKVKNLSNGEKKRVQFIRALLHQPGLLLCDEPTAALDHENTVLLMNELKKISNEIQIIMVTHDIALAETYADRVICLDHGVVSKDLIIHPKNPARAGDSIKTKSFKDTWKLVWKEIKSEVGSTIFQTFILLLCILSTFVVINLKQNITSQSDYISTFKNADNLVLSVPKVSEYHRVTQSSGHVIYYPNLTQMDLFSFDEISKIVKETPEIMAVEAWNSEMYDESFSYIYSLESSYKACHEFTIEGVTHENGELWALANTPDDCPVILKNDFVPFESPIDYANKTFEDPTLEYPQYYTSAYDLIRYTEDIPLIAGELPSQHEVLLSKNAADMYMKLNNYHDYEELPGKNLRLGLLGFRNRYFNSHPEDIPMFDEIELKISGVTSIENDFTTMIFFSDGFGEDPLYQHFVKNPHELQVEYVRFLLKPGSNYQEVADKLDQYFSKENLNILKFDGKGLGLVKEFYQSPAGFIIYGVVILLILFALLLIRYFFDRKKLRKEKNILRIYGYNVTQESMLRNFILTMISMVIALLVISPTSQAINRFAKENYYQPFMDANYGLLAGVSLGIFLVVILFETLFKRGKAS